MRTPRTWWLAAVALALGSTFGGAMAQAILPREVRERILQAVVDVRPYDSALERFVGTGGSGTIISPDGYVLTNFHVVGDLATGHTHAWHAIYVTDPRAPDQAPAFRYWARFVAGDARHDLALVQIVEDTDENPLPAGFTFLSMPVGDSNGLIPGDPITVVGYPGISGATITFTSGIISGFLGEDLATGGKQWIKTDAKLARGNSGGAAFDENGVLVGVPTLRRQTEDGGYIEQQDYLRPIALAWPMISAHVANVNRVAGVGGQIAGLTPPAPAPPSPASAATPAATDGSAFLERGQLGPGDRVLDGGEYVDTFVRDLVAGRPVTIALSSREFDVYLIVLDPEDLVVLEVDDSIDQGLNVAETFVPSSSGPHLIAVTSAYPGEAGAYELSVWPIGGAAGVTPAAAVGAGLGSATGVVGPLVLGDLVRAELAGSADRVAYHTYVIQVPAGSARFTVEMAADVDLDLYLKHGSEIVSLAADGDWDYRDIDPANRATFTVADPAAGPWFVDVVWFGGDGRARYTLRAR